MGSILIETIHKGMTEPGIGIIIGIVDDAVGSYWWKLCIVIGIVIVIIIIIIVVNDDDDDDIQKNRKKKWATHQTWIYS